MAQKEFIAKVNSEIEAELVNRGFRQLRKGRVAFLLSEDMLGWIGLNRGVHPGMVRINPFVGIHSIAVMSSYASYANEKYVKGDLATYAVHLGSLIPSFAPFEFYQDQAVSPTVVRLVDSVMGYGLPFMRSLAGYSPLLELIKPEIYTLGGNPQKYTMLLWLAGRKEEAIKFAEELLAKEGPWAKLPMESCERFARNFLNSVCTNK